MKDDAQQGQCQCGKIQYLLLGKPLMIYACHCLHCQKQSSSAFGISMWMERHEVKFTAAEPTLWITYGDSGAKKICAFCGECGSRIYHARGDNTAPLSMKAGTLNDTSWLNPVAHIWTKRAQPWLKVESSGLFCFEGDPDDDQLARLWRENQG